MLNLYVTSPLRKDGKSFISSGLAVTLQSLGYSMSVYKPVQINGIVNSGFTQSPDLTLVKTMDPYIETQFSYLFKSSLEPMLSAEEENELIDSDIIVHDFKKISSSCDSTIIDGECGIFSPLSPNLLNADLVNKLQIPVLIVTSPSDNSVSSTLSAIYSTLEKGLSIRGVVINNIDDNTPKKVLTGISRIIEEYSNVKILGLVPKIKDKRSPEELITAILNGIDIESVFNVKIEKLDFD